GFFRSPRIREGIELLDVTERMAGLFFDPRPQTGLQRAVGELKWTTRQRACIGDRHDFWFAVGDGHQHRDKISGDRIERIGFSRCLRHARRPSRLVVPILAFTFRREAYLRTLETRATSLVFLVKL